MLYQQILSAVDKIRNKNTFLSHGAGIKCSDHSNPIFVLVMALKCISKHNIPASIVNQFLMHQILIRSVIYFSALYFCSLIFSRLETSIWSTNYFVHNRFSTMNLATTKLPKHFLQIIIINVHYFLGNIVFQITIRFI